MKTLKIRWQRLVDEQGKTCERCGTTELTIRDAVDTLRRSMEPLGMDVVLEKKGISPSEFSRDPLESNRIWIAGEPIERWLSATSGKSRCCSTCGDSDCRTITVDGKTHEAIPAELIVRAGLLAVARLMGVEPSSPAGCCLPTKPSSGESGCCPPTSPSRTK